MSKIKNLNIESISGLDSKDLSNVHQACFTKFWNEDSIFTMIANGIKGLKAIIDGQLVGFILYQDLIDDIEILTFCVSEEFRNNKIGITILKELKKQCKKSSAKRVILEVSQKNEPAQNLYKKIGFKQEAIRKNYYCNGKNCVDGVFMTLKV